MAHADAAGRREILTLGEGFTTQVVTLWCFNTVDRVTPSAGGDRAPRASVVFIVGLTRVELQWRVGSFQLQALNTIGFLNPLTSCGPAAARQSSAVRAVSPCVPCAPTAVRRVDGHF